MGAPCRIACVLAVLLLLTGVLTSAAAMSLPFSTKKVQASSRAVVYKHLTLEQALHDAHQHAGTAVLIVGTAPPRRRAPQQPLLLFSTRAASQVPYAVQQLLVQGLTQLQHLSGGSVGRYCLVLDALSADSQEAAGDGWPLVVFDASTGSVLLGPTVLQALQSTPVHVVSAAVQAMMAAAQQLMHLGGQVLPQDSHRLLQLAPQAARALVAAAAMAAVPKWFCFVCPIVLGLLSPLIINAGVSEAADLACRALQLPDDQCVDLWFAALGLGMILALLSAIPIYTVCHLYECAHPGTPNSTAATATT